MVFMTQSLRAQDEEEKDTYSISLVKTAETDKEIHEIDDQKVLAETYKVAEGDHIWSLLRKRGLLEDSDLPRILAMLKKLNDSLSNLDLIYPGQRIIIPLKISPQGAVAAAKDKKPPLRISPEELKDIDFQNYTVKKGDSIIKILIGEYDIPQEKLHNEYLDLIKRLNPSIENIDRIYPGQAVRLPVYTKEVVRAAIEPPQSETSQKITRQETLELSHKLNQIFTRIGEEWLQSGEHFIPLKPGGQINLKTESYPLINLSNGNKIIVDLYSDLPNKMANLIEANWNFYKVIKLRPGSTLRTALNQILPFCGYERLYPTGTPLDLGGDIGLRLKADWIIRKTPASDKTSGKLVMIHLLDNQDVSIPGSIKTYLLSLGIESIVFPFNDTADESSTLITSKPLRINDRTTLIAELLKVTGKKNSQNVAIPVYKKEKKSFNLTIKADFLFKEQGDDCIIDLNGLDRNTISLLIDHRFKVLSLGEVKEGSQLASRTLKFLNRTFDNNPHDFKALDSIDNTIQLTIPGLSFRGDHDQDILITHLNLPQEVMDFLAIKGYKVLIISKL
jgi:hypothetical protein